MSLSTEDLSYLADCAADAAGTAGSFIAASGPKDIQHKSGHSDASQVVTEVDRQAQELVMQALAASIERFDLGVLSEEAVDDSSRLDKEFFWCIDPLDGTLPFIEGRPDYAVSIALVSREGVPLVGVVFAPASNTFYLAAQGLGLLCNEQPWIPASLGKNLSVFVDRSFAASAAFEEVARALEEVAVDMGLAGLDLHTQGGAVMNACQVLSSPPACYFKLPKAQGGGSLWDFAATACLFSEAGAVVTDIHGAPLDLNRPDSTFLNHRGVLFATDEELARRIRALHIPKS